MTRLPVADITEADIDAAFAGKSDSHSLRPPQGERKGNEYLDGIAIVSIADLGPFEPPD